jgi:hypothetical protein
MRAIATGSPLRRRLMVEKVSGSGGSVRWNEYIFGSEGMVAERFNA